MCPFFPRCSFFLFCQRWHVLPLVFPLPPFSVFFFDRAVWEIGSCPRNLTPIAATSSLWYKAGNYSYTQNLTRPPDPTTDQRKIPFLPLVKFLWFWGASPFDKELFFKFVAAAESVIQKGAHTSGFPNRLRRTNSKKDLVFISGFFHPPPPPSLPPQQPSIGTGRDFPTS